MLFSTWACSLADVFFSTETPDLESYWWFVRVFIHLNLVRVIRGKRVYLFRADIFCLSLSSGEKKCWSKCHVCRPNYRHLVPRFSFFISMGFGWRIWLPISITDGFSLGAWGVFRMKSINFTLTSHTFASRCTDKRYSLLLYSAVHDTFFTSQNYILFELNSVLWRKNWKPQGGKERAWICGGKTQIRSLFTGF